MKALSNQKKNKIAPWRESLNKECYSNKKKIQKLVEIEVTRRCNLNCIMCFNRDIAKTTENNPHLHDGLSTDELKDVIKSAKRLGSEVITLTGGEPFLRDDIFELIKTISENDMRSVIFTNALLITKPIAQKIIDSGLSELYFSIDTVTPSLHDYIRCRKGAFEKMVGVIKKIIDLRNKTQSNMKIYFGTIIMGINLHEILDLVEFGKKLGIDGIALKPVRIHQGEIEDGKIVNHPKTNLKDIDKLWIQPEQHTLLDKVIDTLLLYKKENPSFILDTEDFLNLIRNSYKTPSNDKLGLICNASDYYVVIDKDGYVRCCWGVVWQEDIGNIKYQDLGSILNSSQFKKLREKMKECNLPCFDLLIGHSYLR